MASTHSPSCKASESPKLNEAESFLVYFQQGNIGGGICSDQFGIKFSFVIEDHHDLIRSFNHMVIGYNITLV